MNNWIFNELTGKMLIASPNTEKESIFYKSLVYIIDHSDQHSVGIIVNHVISGEPVNKILTKVNRDVDLSKIQLDIYVGGPIQLEQAFFLHSNDYRPQYQLFESNDNELIVSSSISILDDLSNGFGPKHIALVMGYSAWYAGQLESEIKDNFWIVSKLDTELIFDNKIKNKWELAMNNIGVDPFDFIRFTGRS